MTKEYPSNEIFKIVKQTAMNGKVWFVVRRIESNSLQCEFRKLKDAIWYFFKQTDIERDMKKHQLWVNDELIGTYNNYNQALQIGQCCMGKIEICRLD